MTTKQDAPAPATDEIMALADAVADGAIHSDAKEAAAKAALRAAVEQIVRERDEWKARVTAVRESAERAEQDAARLRDALTRIRDSTHTNATVLRGMAGYELEPK